MRFTVPACMLIAVYVTTASAQLFTGRVVDKRSNPIAGATVALVAKNKSVLTAADGTFSIQGTAILSPYNTSHRSQTVLISGTNLLFTNDAPRQIGVEIFDMGGRRAGDAYNRNFGEGSFLLPLASLVSKHSANGLYIVRVTQGTVVSVHPFNPLSSMQRSSVSASRSDAGIAKQLATADTLKVSKESYLSVALPLDSDVGKVFEDIKLALINDPDVAIEKKVDSLLALMTDAEKIAQTSEVLVDAISTADLTANMYGSVFNGGGCPFGEGNNKKDIWAQKLDALHAAASASRLKIPILYGIDAVHGNATIEGATVFPHNIGMGCTHDTALVAKMANITAKECRAVGINLNFAPAISVVRDEKWGRTYEGYGETPEINSMMAEAYVRGLQGYGDMSRMDAMAACAKHFIGDGGTTGGVNGGETKLSEETVRAVHLPPYQAAVKMQVASIMPSYNAWNRNGQTIRCTNDKFALTTMLKEGLSWDGFCLSDWDAIPRALASSGGGFYFDNNVSAAINAGIDMAMIARDFGGNDSKQYVNEYSASFTRLVTANTIAKTRLDDAVKRILRIKFRLNLFENAKSNSTLLAEFGSAAHRAVARECVQKSVVLLKNEASALPLKKTDKIVVVGPWANKLGAQCGGWTITWQGMVESPSIVGTTILNGLKEVGGATNVTYDETGANLTGADKIVLVVGEGTYAETEGDHGFKNSGEWTSCVSCLEYKNQAMSINLADCPNSALVAKCKASGKPVVVVLLSGRPMIITPELEQSSAFVAAWLPGSEGAGVADVLYGDKKFTGKLTHSWPKSLDQIPINTGTAYADELKGSGGTPLFDYGYGLTF